MNTNSSKKKDEKNLSFNLYFMKKPTFSKKRLKKGFSLHFLKNLNFCPGSVVDYHASLSSSRLGSESRPGRYYNFFEELSKKTINHIFNYIKMVKRVKNLSVLVTLIFLFLSILTMTTPNTHAQETITVGPGPIYDFNNISDAIAYANESDIIHVYSGTYTENIVINKPITINGDGSGSTVLVSANSKKNTIEVTSIYVNVSGFTIKNLGGTFACVWLNSTNNCLISNNYIQNGENGIYLTNSNNNTITDNTIENNKNGINLYFSNTNTIKNNNIQKNDIYGVFISHSSGNAVYLNDFSNNYGSNSRDDGNNNWDYNSQGNYWDDYNDYDSNKDGIGDNPYLISGNGGNKDNFPLGDFLSPSQPVAYIDSISPNPAPNGQTISFIGHGTTPDGTIEFYEWKSDNILISNSACFSTSSLSSGTHSISFRVKNNNDIWSEKTYETLVVNPNQKPIAYILKPTGPAMFGKPVNFTGYGVDPDGEIKAYTWWSVPSFLSSSDASFTISNLPVNNYTIYFKVKDDKDTWSTEVTTTLTIFPNTTEYNSPPVANAKGPYTGFVNQNISFNGSLSFDPNDNVLTYHWEFGDNTTAEGEIVEHMYNAAGNYSVKLTVTDEYGAVSINTTYIVVVSEDNNQDDEDKIIPGFEIMYIFIIILLMVVLRKINNKKRRYF